MGQGALLPLQARVSEGMSGSRKGHTCTKSEPLESDILLASVLRTRGGRPASSPCPLHHGSYLTSHSPLLLHCSCPPWDLTVENERRAAGLFPHPPHPSEISKEVKVRERMPHSPVSLLLPCPFSPPSLIPCPIPGRSLNPLSLTLPLKPQPLKPKPSFLCRTSCRPTTTIFSRSSRWRR